MNDNQVIPDSAMEAAHKAWREQAKQDGTIFEYNLRAAIEAAVEVALSSLEKELESALALIADMTDPDECSFDHHGGCQTHGYLSLQPGETCPQYDAQELIRNRA